MLNKSDAFVSVVILDEYIDFDNSFNIILSIYEHLDTYFSDYEIVIISANSGQKVKVDWQPILIKIPSIRVIELAFELNEEVALSVGLENAIGDYTILFDPMHESTGLIKESVKLCQDGFHVVTGVSDKPIGSIVYRMFRKLGTILINDLIYGVPKNSTTFRCLSRTAVDVITRAKNCHHQIYVRMAQCGLQNTSIRHRPLKDKSNDKGLFYSIKKGLNLLVFNSVHPLRWMSFVGISGGIVSFVFALYSIVIKLLNNGVADGWASLVVLTSFLFTLMFIILSFFGEYLARLLDEQSRHEPYWVIGEKNSSVMMNEERVNVLLNSELTDSPSER